MGRAVHNRAAAIMKRACQRRIGLSDRRRQRLFVVYHRQSRAIAGVGIGPYKNTTRAMSGRNKSRDGVTPGKLGELLKTQSESWARS